MNPQIDAPKPWSHSSWHHKTAEKKRWSRPSVSGFLDNGWQRPSTSLQFTKRRPGRARSLCLSRCKTTGRATSIACSLLLQVWSRLFTPTAISQMIESAE
nr:uncharacterized protein CTRU02_07908 [Colletotrichum truncatum]KAF6791002.1 hypothetical protein CTRU02_07908 [Colletotrichum truncatum]